MYNPKLSHFDLDMARGKQGELFIDNLRDALADKSSTIEVKTDSWFVRTNRFYVEDECRGRDGIWRPSGIAITKARIWAFVIGRHPGAIIIETEWLKRAVERAKRDSPANRGSCDYGKNPTRGWFVQIYQIRLERDMSLDEH